MVHEWLIPQEIHLVKVLTPTSCFYEEVTCKRSTKKGLLYALNESCKEHFKCFSLDTLVWCDVMSTSLNEPAAKVFVARKSRTLHWAKCKEPTGMWSSAKSAWELPRRCHRTSNNQPYFTSLEIPLGFRTRAILSYLAEAYVTWEGESSRLMGRHKRKVW
jgi:hypothetical protein